MLLTVGTAKFDLVNARRGARLCSVTPGPDALMVGEVSCWFPPEIDTQNCAVGREYIAVLHHQPHKDTHFPDRPGVQLYDRAAGLSAIPDSEAARLPLVDRLRWLASVCVIGELLAVAINGQDFASEILLYDMTDWRRPRLWRRLPFAGDHQRRPINMAFSPGARSDGRDATLFVLSYSGCSVSSYSLGEASDYPLTMVRGPSTGLVSPAGAILHEGLLWVSAHEGHELLAFPVGSDGDCSPLRRIAGDKTRLDHPWGLAISDGQLFVANLNLSSGAPPGLLAFELDRDGDVAPSQAYSSAQFPELGGITNIRLA